ncbi:hypothetical protein [Coprobacter sp.]|uniref:hypothetical protein n=1 Tax=Coprobacter sp. TaxID=1941478 RepID=UPI003AB5A81E
MTEKDIEKAANERFYDNSFAYKGFIEGAKWRIDSVWHYGNEIPKINDRIIVINRHGLIIFFGYWKSNNVIGSEYRWFNINDLIPDE